MTRKIALITGASRGLGKSAALHLAAQGVDIIGTYHSAAAEAQAVVEQIQALGGRAAMLQLDVSQSATFNAFVGEVAGVLKDVFAQDHFDFLVNNAGIGAHASFAETTEAQFDQLVAIQFKGPFFLTQKLLPLIRDGGRIGAPYYGSRYWIADPSRYRLPAAGRYQRWVRHYGDVILVDTRRGYVIRVIRNFYR